MKLFPIILSLHVFAGLRAQQGIPVTRGTINDGIGLASNLVSSISLKVPGYFSSSQQLVEQKELRDRPGAILV